jgi:aspartate racemase
VNSDLAINNPAPTDDLNNRIAGLSPAQLALLELKIKEHLDAPSEQSIPRLVNRHSVPLSFAQQRLWFLAQLEPESAAYNQPKAIRLSGVLNADVLKKTLDAIVARHEVLRTTFTLVDGNPVQVIAESGSVELPVIDLSEWPDIERETEVQRLILEKTQQPFNLSQGSMLRATLLRLSEKDHVLLLVTHHIVSDGWSRDLLFREIATVYEGISTGNPLPLPELPIQYADFAIWQRQWLQGEVLESHLAYWKQQLGGSIPVLEVPVDHPRPAVQTYRGARQSAVIPKRVSEAIKSLSRQEGVTLFMTLLSAFQALLHRYTGQDDIVVGSPIVNRSRVEVEGVIGFFANTLVLRADMSGDPTFLELLGRVRQVTLGAYAHQDLPFEKLVEELNPQRDLSHTPLFQVMFALQNAAPTHVLPFSGLTLTPMEVDIGTAKFDLTLTMLGTRGGLKALLEYNSDLFDAATITRMLGHFQTLLEGIVARPEQRLSNLPILTETEIHQLLVEWNNTRSDYPKDKCIHELFEAQVERSPDAVAVVFEDKRLTYRELNDRANQLAHYLGELGVGPEVLVGLCIERSLEMVVALLGILKAGGAYVPLDPTYPKERLAFMLKDTQAPVLLTQQQLTDSLPEHGVRVVCLDRDWKIIAREKEDNLVSTITANNLAYVIYTSGSTGRPKGVSVIHRGVVRLVKETNYADLTEKEVFLQFAPLSFDASTFEIWACLLNGAKLVVFPPYMPSLKELGQALKRYQITTLWLTSALFQLMVEDHIGTLSGVKQLLAGGDVLSVSQVKRVLKELPGCRLINGYGPTENTTFTCCYQMTSPEQVDDSVSIGRPIVNTQVYILDHYLNPVPIGVSGELCIGGDGLARGYFNNRELTAEKFIPHPFSNEAGARLYKTGDLVRYLPDGNIEFLGRLDHQVKIRGLRVEPGEVETMLGEHLAVRQAVVRAREDAPGEKRLVAYVVSSQKLSPTINELRSFLKQKLPHYMVPSAFVFLDALPLTPNGKVDRRALPAPDGTRPGLQKAFVAPRTPVEEVLASIWSKILAVEQVGIYDDFFELGGHSLLVAKLITQIQRDLRVDLPVRFLFEFPTVAQLAACIKATQEEDFHLQEEKGNYSYLVKLQSGQSQTPVFCFPYIGGFRGDLFRFIRLAPLIGPGYSLYGLQARGTDGVSQPYRSVEDMAADYINAIQTLQPHGPYFLVGECFSARVAYETAQQLQARGERVALLAFLDGRCSRQSLGQYLWRRLSAHLRYHIDPISESRVSKSWAGIASYLREIQRLERGKWLRYFFSKRGKVIKLISYLLRGEMPLHPHWANIDGSDAERQKSVQRGQKAYWLALSRYRLRPYEGRITLLVNEEWYDSDPTLRSAELAAGGVEVHKIPGDHLTYITEHVQVVAKKLRECLDRAREIFVVVILNGILTLPL